MRDSVRRSSIKLSRSSPYRSLTLVVALFVLALLLLVLDQAGMLGQVRGQAESLISPALRTLRQLGDGLSGVGQGLSNVQQLQATITAQNEQISQLKAQAIENEALKFQLARLEQQLRIEQDHRWNMFGADVGAHTPDAGRRVLTLAAGSEQGIKPGMAVVAVEGSSPPALIGIVEETGPRSSTVLLITDYSSSVSALIYRQGSTISGLVQGQWQRGSRLLLEQVDRAAPLTPGDTVVTAGLTAQVGVNLPRAAIPRNVPIGTVEAARTDGPAQVAELRPFVDPDRVTYAWVILSQGE